MVMPLSPQDDLSFASKGYVTQGIIACAICLVASLNQILTAVYFQTSQTIDATLVEDPELDLLGIFSPMTHIWRKFAYAIPSTFLTPSWGSSWVAT